MALARIDAAARDPLLYTVSSWTFCVYIFEMQLNDLHFNKTIFHNYNFKSKEIKIYLNYKWKIHVVATSTYNMKLERK